MNWQSRIGSSGETPDGETYVSGIDDPFISSTEMGGPFLRNSIGRKIPHLRVATCDILLHPKERSLGCVFSVAHISKLAQICLNILFGVLASIPGRRSVFSTALQLDIGFDAVTHVRPAQLDQVFGLFIELIEIIGGVGRGRRSEPCIEHDC